MYYFIWIKYCDNLRIDLIIVYMVYIYVFIYWFVVVFFISNKIKILLYIINRSVVFFFFVFICKLNNNKILFLICNFFERL